VTVVDGVGHSMNHKRWNITSNPYWFCL